MRIRNSRMLLDPTPFHPPNQNIPIADIIRTWLFPQTTQQELTTNGDEALKVEKKSCTNETRNLDEELSSKTHLHPSSTSAQEGSFSGGVGNKVHDLKKRKEILDENPDVEKMSPETKFDINNDIRENGNEMDVISGPTSGTAKKVKRGKEIMEGSRCSRVNGRGWRCCQATLVGYSLCEHHLGKGRLRSTASTVSQSNVNIVKGGSTPLNGGVSKIVTKKRTMMVKAKSLNSLLG